MRQTSLLFIINLLLHCKHGNSKFDLTLQVAKCTQKYHTIPQIMSFVLIMEVYLYIDAMHEINLNKIKR